MQFQKHSASHNQQFPLESVTRPTVPTEQAAYYLDRKPQTMRAWACLDNGAIRPLRINGRLAWPVKEIKKVLGVEV
ncbi:MAG: hypothetical protein IPP22_10875 [Nitrosomonas sp.]|nr:hypothetical protein [Nitrosomonas sp.]